MALPDPWGCLCSKCGKWHSHVKRDFKTGKWVCWNCYYNIGVKKEVVKMSDEDKGIKKCTFCHTELDIEDDVCEYCSTVQPKKEE